MPSPQIEMNVAIAGLATPTLDIYPFQSDTALATGIGLTEETNRNGVYTSAVGGLTGLTASGLYYLQVWSGAALQWTGWVRLLDISMIWSAVEDMPDPYPQDILGSVVLNGANTSNSFEVSIPASVVGATELLGGIVQFLTGSLAGQFAELGAMTGGSPNIFNMINTFGGVPAADDVFRVIPSTLERGTTGASTHSAAAVKTEIEQAGSHLALIKAKTDGLNFTGTDVKATLDGEGVDVTKVNGNAAEALALQENLAQMPDSTVDTPQTATTFISGSGDLITGNTNHWAGREIFWLTGAMAGSKQPITASSEVSGPRVQFTLGSNMPGAGPAASDKFRVL